MEPICIAVLAVAIALQAVAAWATRRKAPVEVQCTQAAFRRWLRAQRPPLTWFLALAEDEQQVLADLGEQQARDLCVGIGYAVRDPKGAEAGSAGGVDAEEHLLEQLVGAASAAIAEKVRKEATQQDGTRMFLGAAGRIRQ